MFKETYQTETANMRKLAMVLTDKMKQIAGGATVLDFGSILEDFSLKTNRFPIPLPQGTYFICRMAALPAQLGFGATETADDHRHIMPFPQMLDPIQPGDRVLVAWVDDDAVVIDKFVPAETVEVINND